MDTLFGSVSFLVISNAYAPIRVFSPNIVVHFPFVTFCAQKVTKKAPATKNPTILLSISGGAKKTRRLQVEGLKAAKSSWLKQFLALSASNGAKSGFF